MGCCWAARSGLTSSAKGTMAPLALFTGIWLKAHLAGTLVAGQDGIDHQRLALPGQVYRGRGIAGKGDAQGLDDLLGGDPVQGGFLLVHHKSIRSLSASVESSMSVTKGSLAMMVLTWAAPAINCP
jgi:hypothetical protein